MVVVGGLRAQQVPVPVLSPLGDSLPALYLSPAQAESFKLDGGLGEDFWADARPIDDFRQREPDEGDPATERTEVRVVYSADMMIVGIKAFHADPSLIVSRILQRDRVMSRSQFGGASFAGDDGVAIVFDPFHDHRNGMIFATNANGAEYDALLTDENLVNVDWRGVWEVASKITAEGWSTEFAIPLKTLRYATGGESLWGFNVFRMIRSKNEEVLWRSWQRQNGGFRKASRAGHLIGLGELPEPGITIEAKPFVLTSSRKRRDELGNLPSDQSVEVGLDLKAEVRPGLVLDLTANTDFAQVEVDDQQVNLTRFSLFFPEKRDFFLENSGIFEFGTGMGRGPPDYLMFFSRRVGIGSGGEVPIIGGARLTGRVGGQTVGFMNVITDRQGSEPATNFLVTRLKRDIGNAAYVGFMATDRRNDVDANSAAGVDGSFWVGPVNLRGYWGRTFTRGVGGEGNSYRVNIDFTGDRFGFFLNHLMVGEGTRADMGFINRTDIRKTFAALRYSPRPKILGIRKINIHTMMTYQTRTDNAFQDYEVSPSFSVDFNSGDNVTLSLRKGETQLDNGFTLAGSAPISDGRYDTNRVQLRFRTTSARAFSGSGNLSAEAFFGGTLRAATVSVTASPSPAFTATLSQRRSDIDLPSGGFVSNITSLRAVYSFSTKLSTNVLVQYNSLDRVFSTNVRFNFIHRPGSDLFLVFTEERGADSRLWDLTSRGMVMKLTYLKRL
ncbi:MAG: hypothetical protein BMS9Abin29_2635 [Gemmatimonadota bacterium]|nr:MAG: hypothetical protein BMS9Abin29_2635 [Gemmatimonadota bacterium]